VRERAEEVGTREASSSLLACSCEKRSAFLIVFAAELRECVDGEGEAGLEATTDGTAEEAPTVSFEGSEATSRMRKAPSRGLMTESRVLRSAQSKMRIGRMGGSEVVVVVVVVSLRGRMARERRGEQEAKSKTPGQRRERPWLTGL
jgi:hypothetical protein